MNEVQTTIVKKGKKKTEVKGKIYFTKDDLAVALKEQHLRRMMDALSYESTLLTMLVCSSLEGMFIKTGRKKDSDIYEFNSKVVPRLLILADAVSEFKERHAKILEFVNSSSGAEGIASSYLKAMHKLESLT